MTWFGFKQSLLFAGCDSVIGSSTYLARPVITPKFDDSDSYSAMIIANPVPIICIDDFRDCRLSFAL